MKLTRVGVAAASAVLVVGAPAVALEPDAPFVVHLVKPDNSVVHLCDPDMPCWPDEHVTAEFSVIGDVVEIPAAFLSPEALIADDWATVVVETVAPYPVVDIQVVLVAEDGSRLVLEPWRSSSDVKESILSELAELLSPPSLPELPELPTPPSLPELPTPPEVRSQGLFPTVPLASPADQLEQVAAVSVAKSVLSFGTVTGGSNTVDLGDLRYSVGGSTSGWTVSVVATDLTDGDNRIPASSLTLDPGSALDCSPGVLAESVRHVVRFSGATGGFSAPAAIASGNAAPGSCRHRGGTARLSIPPDTPPGTYSGTIQYTILN